MDKKSSILNQFDKEKELYNDFRIKAELLIKELLIQGKINYHQIVSRLKSKNKIEEKIDRKGGKYSHLTNLTDISGVRVITYFEDEVDSVAKIIEKEFIVDFENTIDKRKLETDRFGYKSLHYVVSLNESRTKLIEYKRFANLKIEIQIRSILQHAWAEIEHDIGYKGEISIPENLKRNFHRVAALLETSDIEFVNIRQELELYKLEVEEKLKANNNDLKIDKVTYFSFLKNDELVKKIDIQISKKTNCIYKNKLSRIEYFEDVEFQRLQFLKISTISELQSLLVKHEQKIVELAYLWAGDKDEDSYFSTGISVFYLCYYLIGLSKDINYIESYFRHFINHSDIPGNRESAEKLLKIINSIE